MADDEDKTYIFDELSPEAQERACDNHRYWNVDDNSWLETEYYETWLNELCENRGVSFDVGGSMAIGEEYNRWRVEIDAEYEAMPFEVDKWILATPTPRAFGSINNYKLFVSDFESLLEKKKKTHRLMAFKFDAPIESQRQTMLSFLKGNLEGVHITLRMDYEGNHYATHLKSSNWAVDSIKIERTIDGEEYVYEHEDMIWSGYAKYDDMEYLTMDGMLLRDFVEGREGVKEATSISMNIIKPIYDAATLALAPMFKEWFDEKIDYLAESAEKQYDYLISDESIGESLMANEIEFDKDGNRA
jgi:hypothetical protein